MKINTKKFDKEFQETYDFWKLCKLRDEESLASDFISFANQNPAFVAEFAWRRGMPISNTHEMAIFMIALYTVQHNIKF